MSDAIGMSFFGACICLMVLIVFLVRKPLARAGGKLVHTKDPEKLYRFQVGFGTVMSGICFLGGLTMVIAGLIWEFGG